MDEEVDEELIRIVEDQLKKKRRLHHEMVRKSIDGNVDARMRFVGVCMKGQFRAAIDDTKEG